jgi:hypothetical protein
MSACEGHAWCINIYAASATKRETLDRPGKEGGRPQKKEREKESHARMATELCSECTCLTIKNKIRQRKRVTPLH